jgi:hypothetical protein
MAELVIVTGLKTGFGPTTPPYDYPQRKEWYDFKKNSFHLALYVRSLDALMKFDQSQTTSFFQIAGTYLGNLLTRHSRPALCGLGRSTWNCESYTTGVARLL